MTEPHAITRTRERYGLEITLADLRRMEADCFEKKGIYFGDVDGGAERWMIQCRGVGITVLFRRSSASIVTVLPKRNAVTKLIGGDELKRGAHKLAVVPTSNRTSTTPSARRRGSSNRRGAVGHR